MYALDKKLRIVVVGRSKAKDYVESKLRKEVIPDSLSRFTDCDQSDIMFCISSYFSGVGPVVSEFEKEYKYPIKEFQIDWSKGKGGLLITNDIMLNFAMNKKRAVIVSFYNGYGADFNIVSKASLLQEQFPNEILVKDYRIRY